MRGSLHVDDDPLARAIAPPADETPEAKQARLGKEAEAKRVSDEIDEVLKKEKASMKKRQSQVVRMLLLGQSESGGLFSVISLHLPGFSMFIIVFETASTIGDAYIQASQRRSKVSRLLAIVGARQVRPKS